MPCADSPLRVKGVFSQTLEVLPADNTQLPALSGTAPTAECKALPLPKAACIQWLMWEIKVHPLPPTPDNSEGSSLLQSSLWGQLRSPLRLLCRLTFPSVHPASFPSLPSHKRHLTPESFLINSLHLISISDPASQGTPPAKQTCDLLLTERIWQEWWAIMSVIKLHKTVTSIWQADSPPCWLSWRWLRCCEPFYGGAHAARNWGRSQVYS